mmetsp:Transcript_22189/g.44888  ORF Transcript_22189/g.44888 Transcript_22189/m.44888 type:complete len:127 (-) Transcript_22189:252-632(-)
MLQKQQNIQKRADEGSRHDRLKTRQDTTVNAKDKTTSGVGREEGGALLSDAVNVVAALSGDSTQTAGRGREGRRDHRKNKGGNSRGINKGEGKNTSMNKRHKSLRKRRKGEAEKEKSREQEQGVGS